MPRKASEETSALVADAATQVDFSTMEKVLMRGDLAQLTPKERVDFYTATCASLGLNPLTKPFEYISLNNKMTLYARKDCTEQLRRAHNVSLSIMAREVVEGVYVVTARATMPNGRQDESIGAVPIEGLKGENRANAMMRGETKAKRRVTLSICGLGMLDETEIDSISDAKRVTVNFQTGEISDKTATGAPLTVEVRPELEAPKEPEKKPNGVAPPGAPPAPDHFELWLVNDKNSDKLDQIAGEDKHLVQSGAELRAQAIANEKKISVVVMRRPATGMAEELGEFKPSNVVPMPAAQSPPEAAAAGDSQQAQSPQATAVPDKSVIALDPELEAVKKDWGETVAHFVENTTVKAPPTAESRLKNFTLTYWTAFLGREIKSMKELAKLPMFRPWMARLRALSPAAAEVAVGSPTASAENMAGFDGIAEYTKWPVETMKLVRSIPKAYPDDNDLNNSNSIRSLINAWGLSDMVRLAQKDETLTPDQTYAEPHAFLRLFLVCREAGRLLTACKQYNVSITSSVDQIETSILKGPIEKAPKAAVQGAIETYIGDQIKSIAASKPRPTPPEPPAPAPAAAVPAQEDMFYD